MKKTKIRKNERKGTAPFINKPLFKKIKTGYSKFKSFINFHKFKKHYPSGLIIMFGQRGTGKSTDIAKQFYQEYKKHLKGKSCYSNFYTNVKLYPPHNEDGFYKYLDLNKFKFTDYINPDFSQYDISTYDTAEDKPEFTITKNAYICLDELGIIAQNRDYKNFPKQFTNYVKLLRHYGIFMVAYSQAYDIDKSLRTGANDLYLMRKFFNLTCSLKLKKIISVNTDKDNNQDADSQIMDKIKFCSPLLPSSWKITYIPLYTDLFDSYD